MIRQLRGFEREQFPGTWQQLRVDHVAGRAYLNLQTAREHLTPAIEDRAMAVQQLLAGRGQHRAPPVADLLLAATGELSDLTVLHVDKDFDLIVEITGQPVERFVVDTS